MNTKFITNGKILRVQTREILHKVEENLDSHVDCAGVTSEPCDGASRLHWDDSVDDGVDETTDGSSSEEVDGEISWWAGESVEQADEDERDDVLQVVQMCTTNTLDMLVAERWLQVLEWFRVFWVGESLQRRKTFSLHSPPRRWVAQWQTFVWNLFMPVSMDMASIFSNITVLQNTRALKTGLVKLIVSTIPAILNDFFWTETFTGDVYSATIGWWLTTTEWNASVFDVSRFIRLCALNVALNLTLQRCAQTAVFPRAKVNRSELLCKLPWTLRLPSNPRM